MGSHKRSRFFWLIVVALIGAAASAAVYWRANPQCAALPGGDLLPNSDFSADVDGDNLPDGWDAAVKGPVHLAAEGDYTVTGHGRSIQIIGIANALYSPKIAVQPGVSYCVVAQALADQAPAPTKIQVRFHWLDAAGVEAAQDTTGWLAVKTPAGGGWSILRGSFSAPPDSAGLRVSFHPASDDRIYLDEVHLRHGGAPLLGQRPIAPQPAPKPAVAIAPWPDGKQAALSFSFDWETAMGGLIHSRSVEDPYADQDPVQRGLRMRQGITETLKIFQPYGIRATYYATGYNFLTGNRAAESFMGNPTYAWATPANRWRSDWSKRPWFSLDPHTDIHDIAGNGAAWYFGDLIPMLKQAGQDIQSHTFSHFYGGFVGPDDWRADFAAWHTVAARQGVAPARSLAFPWSGSGGMSYAAWDVLVENGITAVTRLSHQPQYRLFAYANEVPVAPRCVPLPGHESILACPDVYLTPGAREAQALKAIDAALQSNGMVDIWAHTEEVTSPAQIATWRRVVAYASGHPTIWIAPLAELTDWQRAIASVRILRIEPEINAQSKAAAYQLTVVNQSARRLDGVTLTFPFAVAQAQIDAQQPTGADQRAVAVRSNQVALSLDAGQTVVVRVSPAA